MTEPRHKPIFTANLFNECILRACMPNINFLGAEDLAVNKTDITLPFWTSDKTTATMKWDKKIYAPTKGHQTVYFKIHHTDNSYLSGCLWGGEY